MLIFYYIVYNCKDIIVMPFEANISLNKIAYSVAHTLGDVENFYLREKIKFEAIQFRALLIRRDLERNFITRNFIQYICLKLECKDLSDCCEDLSYENGLRTLEQIPTPLRTKDFDSFYYVGTNSKKSAFKETTFDNLELMEHRRFTSRKPLYVYDNYVWIFNPPTKDFDTITIGAIFEDPRQLADIKNCGEEPCYTDDSIFPMGADQYPALEEYLLNLFRNQRPVEDKQIKINDN